MEKEIEGKEYDFCAECWKPFEQKLMRKGRTKSRDVVLLPPATLFQEKENEEQEPARSRFVTHLAM